MGHTEETHQNFNSTINFSFAYFILLCYIYFPKIDDEWMDGLAKFQWQNMKHGRWKNATTIINERHKNTE